MVTHAAGKELVNSGHTYLAVALQLETARNHEGPLI
jgi:hypothetical protein